MLYDYFKIALGSLYSRKLRTLLTVIGIFIGIMAVVSLVSLSQGMENALLDEFRKIGTNRIIMTPGGAEMGPLGGLMSSAKFTEADFQAIENLRGVEIASSVYAESADIKFNRETVSKLVWGFPLDSERIPYYERESMFEIAQGRFLRQSDKYKVVIGNAIAYDEFDKDVKIGDKLLINGYEFEVVGIHKKMGAITGDDTIRINKETAREIFAEPDEVTSIFITAMDNFDVDDVAARAKKALRKLRDVKEGEEDFTVQTSEQVIKTFEAVLGMVQAVLVGIAGISLVVGGVGIMNTMYMSVIERTREIGIMKSVGARNSTIMTIFLIESGFLGLVGGIVGVTSGLILSKIAEIIAFQFGIETLKAYMGAPLILGMLAFAFFVGCVSGSFPAYQASRLNPVDALRK
jgi:putative ABC transport system permease protein